MLVEYGHRWLDTLSVVAADLIRVYYKLAVKASFVAPCARMLTIEQTGLFLAALPLFVEQTRVCNSLVELVLLSESAGAGDAQERLAGVIVAVHGEAPTTVRTLTDARSSLRQRPPIRFYNALLAANARPGKLNIPHAYLVPQLGNAAHETRRVQLLQLVRRSLFASTGLDQARWPLTGDLGRFVIESCRNRDIYELARRYVKPLTITPNDVFYPQRVEYTAGPQRGLDDIDASYYAECVAPAVLCQRLLHNRYLDLTLGLVGIPGMINYPILFIIQMMHPAEPRPYETPVAGATFNQHKAIRIIERVIESARKAREAREARETRASRARTSRAVQEE